MRSRGFTLLETVLAATMGGMVILVSIGLFSLINRSDAALDKQYSQSRQMGTLQIVLRRAFNSMLMAEDNRQSLTPTDQRNQPIGQGQEIELEAIPWDGTGERPRVIIQPDRSAELERARSYVQEMAGDPMGEPQRLELVLPRSPIPSSMRLPTQSWLSQGIDVENELEVYGISGSLRCVFELRPNGSRELMLREAGLAPAGGERIGREIDPGWTLWFRPVFPDEVVREAAGAPATEEEMQRAAIEGYPVLRGIKHARFIAFDNGYRMATFAARTASDLPAYVEVEIETYSGLIVNWMFEVGWVNGPDPSAPPPPAEGEGEGGEQNQNGDQAGNQNDTGGSGDRAGGRRPTTTRPTQQRPGENPGQGPGQNPGRSPGGATRPGGGT